MVMRKAMNSTLQKHLFCDNFINTVATDILKFIEKRLNEQASCRVVLGGGNTPVKINAKLLELNNSFKIDWSKVEFFLSDERYVSENSEHSNYRMLNQTLFSELRIREPMSMIDENGIEYSILKYSEHIKHGLKEQMPFLIWEFWG